MNWNWQKRDWPHFSWDKTGMAKAEEQFLLETGVFVGTVKHLGPEDREQLTVEAMSTEALTTSEIEGEILDRASVQSSIRKQLGLAEDKRRPGPAEQGIAEMMVDLYRRFSEPLSHEMLFAWHRMLVRGRRDLREVGRYRTDEQPMQVVSGAIHAPRVHFEAPPSSAMPQEMRGFINWFNRTAPGSGDPLPNLTRAGIAHPISSPFIPSRTGTAALPGRLPKKRWHKAGVSRRSSLRRRLSSPGASSINEALEAANKHTEITAWLRWFAATAIEAQRRTIARVEFLIDKTRLLDRLRGQLNDRQEKVLLRMLREGPEGFKGGLSAGKYSGITGASPATTTRDLTDLVAKGALIRVGERRHARYHIAIPLRPASPVVIGL